VTGLLSSAVAPAVLNAQASDDTLIDPLKRVGPVEFGMGPADVLRILGDPDRSYENDGATMYVYSQKGIEVLILDRTRGVVRINVLSKPWATKDGIMVGASMLRAEAFLGKPNDVVRFEGSGSVAYYRYGRLGMWIWPRNDGSVSSISLFDKPW
jgi:hypothetical protein